MTSDFPLINAVIEKKQHGDIIINDKNNPSVVFVINKAGFSQVLKAETNNDLKSLAELIAVTDKVPAYFHIYDYPAGLDQALLSEGLKIKKRQRKQFRYTGVAQPQKNLIRIEDINYSNIGLLSEYGLDNYKKYWDSESDLLKNGYGSIYITETGIPASVCYSACVAGRASEIDIVTSSDYQNKGYATAACLHYICLSKERNIIPSWDCFSENIASVNVAKKIGFVLIKEYRFLSVFNEEKSKRLSCC